MIKWPLINLVQVWKCICAPEGSSELYKRDNFSPSSYVGALSRLVFTQQPANKRELNSNDLTTVTAVDITYGKSDMNTDRNCWQHSIAR
jgi:hypothetical protein